MEPHEFAMLWRLNKQPVSDSYLHNNGVMRCYHVCTGVAWWIQDSL